MYICMLRLFITLVLMRSFDANNTDFLLMLLPAFRKLSADCSISDVVYHFIFTTTLHCLLDAIYECTSHLPWESFQRFLYINMDAYSSTYVALCAACCYTIGRKSAHFITIMCLDFSRSHVHMKFPMPITRTCTYKFLG